MSDSTTSFTIIYGYFCDLDWSLVAQAGFEWIFYGHLLSVYFLFTSANKSI